ncbi:Chromate transport protein [Variovorax sp. RA8]|nr:Chromate transport protein [Variovorax sp. RA8]
MSAQTTTGAAGPEAVPPTLTYFQLFMRFLKFGFLAWGGPVAQVAMLRRELVNEERWISSERFNRLLAVMQVLPRTRGARAVRASGHACEGAAGRGAGRSRIHAPGIPVDAGAVMALLPDGHRWHGTGRRVPWCTGSMIALIVRAVHRIGEHILVDRWLWAIAIVAALASAAGVAFWITLPAPAASMPCGCSSVAGSPSWSLPARWRWPPRWRSGRARTAAGGGGRPGRGLRCCSSSSPGLKAGLLTFGGAYTAIPFIRNDAVGRGWITDGQFSTAWPCLGCCPRRSSSSPLSLAMLPAGRSVRWS